MPQTINLRNLPDELVRRVKARAALEGITMRQFVIDTLEAATQDDQYKVQSTRRKPNRKH